VAERKRGNSEGGKPRKPPDGRWEARYTDADGRRKSVYGSARKEVAGKLTRALASKDEPPTLVPTNITVGEFFDQYEEAVRDIMKRRSLETYQDVARLHLLPMFGSKKLTDLNDHKGNRVFQQGRQTSAPFKLHPSQLQTLAKVCKSALYKLARGNPSYLHLFAATG
jgi:hypothetical protein